jgi:hypothetical protein
MQAFDWTVLSKGLDYTVGWAYNQVMKSASKMWVYGEAQGIVPVFGMDKAGVRHGVVTAAGRSGLARAVGMADTYILTGYTSPTGIRQSVEAKIPVNSLFWAAGGSTKYTYRIGVAAGSNLDRADVWLSLQEIGVSESRLQHAVQLPSNSWGQACSVAFSAFQATNTCWGGLLHIDMLIHNRSDIACRDRSRRPETVSITKENPTSSRGCYQAEPIEHQLYQFYQLSTRCRGGLPATSSSSVGEPSCKQGAGHRGWQLLSGP